MSADAILFDLDGTLADTLDDIAIAVNLALTEHGFPTHDVPTYRQLVGEGVERLVERAMPPDTSDDAEAVLEAVKRHYVDRILDRTSPYPGIEDLLDGVTARGIPMAVLSNKPEPATRHIVERLFDRWTFDVVAGGLEDVPLKPDPTAALGIAGRLGAAPERCVYLGDTLTDMQTAVNAGMFAVGALWGFRDRDELLEHGADVVIEHPTELLSVIDRLGSDVP